jgi:hypothetical protein
LPVLPPAQVLAFYFRNSQFARMPRDLAMSPKCRALLVGEEHPAVLIVAAVLGFEGTRIGLALSEAAKAKPGPPAAFRVEMAKPPDCSIKTPDRLFFL